MYETKVITKLNRKNMKVYFVKALLRAGLLGTRDYNAIFIPDLEIVFGIAYQEEIKTVTNKAWLEYRFDLCKSINEHINQEGSNLKGPIIDYKEIKLGNDLLIDIISTANFVRKNPKEKSEFAARNVKTKIHFDGSEEALYAICSGRAIEKSMF